VDFLGEGGVQHDSKVVPKGGSRLGLGLSVDAYGMSCGAGYSLGFKRGPGRDRGSQSC
jgi:hypothetical protein